MSPAIATETSLDVKATSSKKCVPLHVVGVHKVTNCYFLIYQ